MSTESNLTRTEEIIAAGAGLITAGPLGAPASWFAIKKVNGKWFPWSMLGVVAAPFLVGVQIGGLAVIGDALTPSISEVNVEETQIAGAPVANAPTASTGVNLANYGRIQNGMTYDEVVQILGVEGTELSSSGSGQYRTVMYSWDGQGGFGANIIFSAALGNNITVVTA